MPLRTDPSLISVGAGSAIPGSVSASATPPSEAGSSGALDAHLAASFGAHTATSISIQDVFERYLSGDAEGAFGELAALVPPSPGPVGSAGPPWLGSTNSGIPDWGILKLWDGALNLSSVNNPNAIFPYYWRSAVSRSGTGVDPVTDPVFNVVDGSNVYTGGGSGKAHAGFTTSSVNGNPADGFPTWRILPAIPLSVGGDVAVVVSGIVSPADRGVLALVTWDTGDLSAPVPATSVSDVENRCIAAVLLGRGIASGGAGCDGDPGGIFSLGTPTPYDFPGQASGQYDLDEIQGGFSRTPGPAPTGNPSAGQVRLLTDPAAATFSPPTNADGIPVFGATTNSRGGVGTDGNFLAYRLPYLMDYSNSLTGLPYTPTEERSRYFINLAPSSTFSSDSGGGYDDFTANYWAVQIARYRHRFVLALGTASSLRRDGSYALVHFRREADFESYVRDGVAPIASQVYSVNLVNWSGSAQTSNLIEQVDPKPSISSAYSVNCSEIMEDPSSGVPALFGINSYTLSVKGGATGTSVSGVSYFTPRDPNFAVANTLSYNLGITDISAQVTDVFSESYRSHDQLPTAGPLLGDSRFRATNQNPLFMSLSSFSFEGDENNPTPGTTISLGGVLVGSSLFPAELGQVRRQRIEFGYADLRGGDTDPAPSDNAVIQITGFTIANGIRFEGDQFQPSFTTDAKVRLFARRPLNTDVMTGYPLPASPGDGLDLPLNTAVKTLYHSMKENNVPAGGIKPTYGNPVHNTNAVQNATKDKEERFLDEIYRYPQSWLPSALSVETRATLSGPGLPLGFSPIQVPVRPILGDPNYPGFYFSNLSVENLVTSVVPGIQSELQVAGLPARNAPYTDGVTSPFPSRGLLVYPQTDYSTGYNPTGPDYSGAVGDRVYQRCFDAGAANVGATSLILRFWGLSLSDLSFAGSGLGGVGVYAAIKIPGLTTWLDVGRVDGSGPSKQDPILDGAGCMVSGPNTFELIDPESQILYTQIEVSTGPLATLFLNSEGKCPVLVKVCIRDNPTGRALNWENVPATDPTRDVRGLVGIEVVT